MALALASRTSGLTADDLVDRGAAAVGDWHVIPAPPSSEQTYSALVHAAGALAAVIAGDPDGPVWVVDAGRLSARSPALPFAKAADHVLVVTAGRSRRCSWCPTASRPLRAAGCAVSVVVVEPTSWATDEIAEFVAADVVAVLPRVKSAATAWRRCAGTSGARGGGGSRTRRRTSVVDVRPATGPDRRRGDPDVSIADAPVTLEEVIEAVQEALVAAESGATSRGWDDLEREAFAHDVATSYVSRRARAAIESGSTPMDVAAENDLIRRALAAYFHAGKFQVLLDLEGVTDIMVNAHDAIWLQHVDGRTERYPHRVFADADDLRVRGRPPRPARRRDGAALRRRQAPPRAAPPRRIAPGRGDERLDRPAGGDPPERAAGRVAGGAGGAGHHRPRPAVAAGVGDGQRACAW